MGGWVGREGWGIVMTCDFIVGKEGGELVRINANFQKAFFIL